MAMAAGSDSDSVLVTPIPHSPSNCLYKLLFLVSTYRYRCLTLMLVVWVRFECCVKMCLFSVKRLAPLHSLHIFHSQQAEDGYKVYEGIVMLGKYVLLPLLEHCSWLEGLGCLLPNSLLGILQIPHIRISNATKT